MLFRELRAQGYRGGDSILKDYVRPLRRRRAILTPNKGRGEWGEVLGDAVIATAILDRLLPHSHVLNIRGESYRLREKKQAGLFGVGSAPLAAVMDNAIDVNRQGEGQFSTGETGSKVRRR